MFEYHTEGVAVLNVETCLPLQPIMYTSPRSSADSICSSRSMRFHIPSIDALILVVTAIPVKLPALAKLEIRIVRLNAFVTGFCSYVP